VLEILERVWYFSSPCLCPEMFFPNLRGRYLELTDYWPPPSSSLKPIATVFEQTAELLSVLMSAYEHIVTKWQYRLHIGMMYFDESNFQIKIKQEHTKYYGIYYQGQQFALQRLPMSHPLAPSILQRLANKLRPSSTGNAGCQWWPTWMTGSSSHRLYQCAT
jgi:hypothetical protein